MSLIANALKAAQQAKDRNKGGDTVQERRVRSMVGDPHARGLSAPRSQAGPLVSPVVFGGLVVAAFAIGALAWKLTSGGDEPAVAARPDALQAQTEPPLPIAEVAPYTGDEEGFPDAMAVAEDPAEFEAEQAAPLRSSPPARNRPMERQPIADAQPGTFVPVPAVTSSPAEAENVERTSPGNFRLSVDVPADDMTDLLRRAMRAYAAGDYAQSTDLYLRAIAAGGASAEVYNNLGVAYRAAGDLTRARDAYQRALQLDPRHAGSWSNLGVIMDALGDSDQATAAYQRALEFDPSNAPAKVNLARHYHAGKLLADARRLFEEALRFDPLLAEAHYGLARVLEDQGDRAGAILHYQNFLSTHADRFPREAASVRRRLQELVGKQS